MNNKTITIVAIVSIFAMSCISSEDPNKRTKQGAAVGAAAGAVLGTIVGHQNDEKGEGAVIGAAAGAGVGALIGRRMDRQQQELEKLEGVEVTRTADDQIDIAINNEILFDVDSAQLRPRARTTLEEIAGVFREYPDTNLRVEGHADSTGSDAHNQRLSDRRAESVSNYLELKGVSSARVDAIGFGEGEPRASNSTEEGRQLNRRVEIRIKAQG